MIERQSHGEAAVDRHVHATAGLPAETLLERITGTEGWEHGLGAELDIGPPEEHLGERA